MNARQRRRRRRALGCKPPFRCAWCCQAMTAWDSPCDCPPYDITFHRMVRKMPWELTLSEWAGEYVRRDLPIPDVRLSIPDVLFVRTSPKPSDDALGGL